MGGGGRWTTAQRGNTLSVSNEFVFRTTDKLFGCLLTQMFYKVQQVQTLFQFGQAGL